MSPRAFVWLLLGLLVGCASTGPSFIVPEGSTIRGVAPAWTPTEADVARAERGLRAYLRTTAVGRANHVHGPIWQRLGDYGRQYVGVMRNGRRALFINLFWVESPFYQRGDERVTIIQTHDCGDCNAQVYFDVERGVYLDAS